MNIATQELGLTAAAKRKLLRLDGVETLQDLVDGYSEQELFEDEGFQKQSVTYTSIINCLNEYGMRLHPTFYERKKALGEIPTAKDPENILLVDLELSGDLIKKMGYWKHLKTLGDLSRNLKEYGLKKLLKPKDFDLHEFSGKVTVPVEESEVVGLSWDYNDGNKAYSKNFTEYHRNGRFRDREKGDFTMVYTYTKKVWLDSHEKRLLIRTLTLYGLYPAHARVRPTLL